MRKAIKKVVTVVASLSMVAAMGISAFAADYYQFVGNPNLFGNADRGSEEVGWQYLNENQYFKEPSSVDGVYTYTGNYVKASDYDTLTDEDKGKSRQFKVLADGQDFAWNYQMCLGNPEAAWADNQSQFEVVEGSLAEGEYHVYMDPAKGFVCLVQNGKQVELKVRYHTRDEDSWNFVELKKSAIVADGYDAGSVYFDDAAYASFVEKCVAADGGSAKAEEPTTAAPTTAAAETQTQAKAATSQTTAPKTGDVAPVAVIATLVAAMAVITVAAKKKEA